MRDPFISRKDSAAIFSRSQREPPDVTRQDRAQLCVEEL
jgi:hypothetical protein